jgi:hypothetical protein
MQTRAWYKQFWPWVLIGIPIFTFLKAGHSIYIMNQERPDLVIDDYYSEGKAINMNLAKYREAALRNLNGSILIAADKSIVRIENNKALGDSIELRFMHNTMAAKDFTIKAERSGADLYVAQLPMLLDGKWNLVVTDTTEQWKLRATFTLPQSQAIKLGY